MCLQTGACKHQGPVCGGSQLVGARPAPLGPRPRNKALPQAPLGDVLCLKHANSHGVRMKVPWALRVCVLIWQAVVRERTSSCTPWTWLPEGTGPCRLGRCAPGPSWRERGQGTHGGHRAFPGLALPWIWACGNPSLTDGVTPGRGPFLGESPTPQPGCALQSQVFGLRRVPCA